MKRLLSLILALITVASLAACGEKQEDKKDDAPADAQTAQADEYVLSKDVDKATIVDGVMTDISGSDAILKKSNPTWLDDCVLYEVNIRQFTEEGTFKAFEAHLDRLADMGVNTLWLMPIHPISETEKKGTLGSYYAVSDYKGVNPEFGTIEDFRHLVKTAHEKGFKVMLDWVANHTGWDNAWVKDHDDWFVHNKKGEITSPYDWTDTAELDYNNYQMRAEMISCMQYWIEEEGVDGFRCDHVEGVPAPFWNAAVYKLKSINKDILMLAESSATPNLTSYAFDLCYNDSLYSQAVMLKGGIGTSGVKAGLERGGNYSDGSYPMNYMDNHDKNSYEGSVVFRFKDAYPALLAMSFIAPGVPLIYTSDEQGYDHEIEFFEKDAVKWDKEPKYAEMITALSKLKKDHKALDSTNTDITFPESDNENAFAFTRKSGNDSITYIGNLLYEDVKGATVKPDFDKATCIMHFDGKTLSMDEVEMNAGDFVKKDYKPYEFYILIG